MLGLPQIAVGAVIAAIIAGIISLLGLIISKEQKNSEFRQNWIDGLRTEISNLIAHASALHAASLTKAGWTDTRPDFIGINQAAASIRLRLNPKEKPSQRVLKSMDALDVRLRPGRQPDHIELDKIMNELVRDAQILLKEEWNRVRRGELVFRLAKYGALASILLFVGLLSVAAFLNL